MTEIQLPHSGWNYLKETFTILKASLAAIPTSLQHTIKLQWRQAFHQIHVTIMYGFVWKLDILNQLVNHHFPE